MFRKILRYFKVRKNFKIIERALETKGYDVETITYEDENNFAGLCYDKDKRHFSYSASRESNNDLFLIKTIDVWAEDDLNNEVFYTHEIYHWQGEEKDVSER